MGTKRYVICDIEATGLDSDRDLIEIALITWEDDKIVDIYETLINPLKPVPEFISNLTSISNRELKEAPKFYEIADSIRMRLEGAVFVSHNTDFDLGLLKKKYQEMGQELKVKNFCTLKVAQLEIPGLTSYNLEALCHFFRIKITDRHRAIGDARATLELFKELMQLRLKVYPKLLYLPHHERILKNIPHKSGLLYLKDEHNKVIEMEACFDLEKTARERLVVNETNREILINTKNIDFEVTGSALIAEFKKLLFYPYKPDWVIVIERKENGEDQFKVRPFKKNSSGLWYFRDFLQAKSMVKSLEKELFTEKFVHRDGPISKEEILKNNQRIERLSKDAKFPTENLIILGDGRKIGEKSFILVRNSHVLGYGYSEASEDEIFKYPEAFLKRRFFQHLGVDLATKKYIRILKNIRVKTESWRSLSEITNN